MFLLLLACDADKPAPAADTAGPAEPDTTADTDDTAAPEPWVPPDPGCVLAHPATFTEAPILWHVYGPDLLHLFTLSYEFEAYEADRGCPTATSDPTTGTTTWEGDCDLGDFAFAGRWTQVQYGDDIDGYWLQQGEGIRVVDAYWTGWSYTFDGVGTYEEHPDGTGSLDRAYAITLGGDYGPPEVAGAWSIQSFERWLYGDSYSWEAQIDAASDAGLDGDYCVLQESRRFRDCDAEPWGGWVLQGATTVVVTFDPDVACDGCGAVTIDGTPAGEVCGDSYGAWVP